MMEPVEPARPLLAAKIPGTDIEVVIWSDGRHELSNLGAAMVDVDYLNGWPGVMPPGTVCWVNPMTCRGAWRRTV